MRRFLPSPAFVNGLLVTCASFVLAAPRKW